MDGILESAGPPENNAPVITISGTAGVGKTALALHWAHRVAGRFPDGRWYVDLRGYDERHPVDPDEALTVFLRRLGIPPAAFPSATADRAALYRTLVARRRMLIVLDNARDADHVRDLLPGATSSLVLVTSRNALSEVAARRIVLDHLSAAEAHALLRTHVGDRIDAEPGAAAALAGQCARLPLALRIAARLACRKSLSELVAELTDERTRLHVLDAGDPQSRARAVFSWSYRNLPPPAARLFRLWGAQPARELGLPAVAALAGLPQPAAEHAVDTLVRAHLVRESGLRRYRVHDLLAAYAGERTRAVDPDDVRGRAFTRLFDHYLNTAAAAVRLVHPHEWHTTTGDAAMFPDRATAFAWLDTERANLVAAALYAADHGWPSRAVRMSTVLYRYLDVGCHYAESALLHATALRVASPTELGHVLAHHSVVLWRAGRYREMLAQHRRALSLHRAAGQKQAEASALANLGAVHWRLGAYDEALSCYRLAHAMFAEAGDRCRMAYSVGHIGVVYAAMGRHEEAHHKLATAVALLRELGDTYGESGLLDSLGLTCGRLGRYDAALRHYARALTLVRGTGDRQCEAEVLNSLGTTVREAGAPGRALAHHRGALERADEIGDRFERARAHEGIAECHHSLGDVTTARAQWRLALDIHDRLGTPEAQRIRARLHSLWH